MKKLIFLFALLVSFVFVNAQCVTRSLKYMGDDETLFSYTGTAADTINGSSIDTIRVPIQTKLQTPYRVSCEVTLTARAGADTTYQINIYGRNSLNQSWTKTEAIVTSSAVATVQYPVASNLSEAYYMLGDSTVNSTTPNACLKYTFTPTNSNLYWRYLMVEVIAKGNDSVGTGVLLTGFTLKLYKR